MFAFGHPFGAIIAVFKTAGTLSHVFSLTPVPVVPPFAIATSIFSFPVSVPAHDGLSAAV